MSSPGFRSVSEGYLENIRKYAAKVEDYVDIYSHPLRPYLPTLGRFLIISTFLEDALRIVTDWGTQLWFLESRRGFPKGLSHLFLAFNVVVMLTASFLTMTRRYTEYAVAGLLSVVIIQGIGYGLITEMNFFLRNLSVIGGLLMVFSDSMVSGKKNFAGLPTLSETDRRKYFQLTGRVLLIFLFLGVMFQGQWSFSRIIFSLLGLGLCGMVSVGFKAKWSAALLVIILSIFNVFVNNWWSIPKEHHQRDFLKYDFFQTLSIVGGLLLLANMGPGSFSVDEKKKNY